MSSVHARYAAANREKDPYKNLEQYILPLAVAVAAWLARYAMAGTCVVLCCVVFSFGAGSL